MEALASFECNKSAYWQRGVQQKTGVAHFDSGFVRNSNYLYLVGNTDARRIWTARVPKNGVSESCSLGDEAAAGWQTHRSEAPPTL